MQLKVWRWLGAFGGLVAMVALLAGPLRAHEIRPAIVSLKITKQQRFEMSVKINAEALIAKVGSLHKDTDDSPVAKRYNALRAMPPKQLRQRFKAFTPIWLDGMTLKFGGRRITPEVLGISIAPTGDLALARNSIIRLIGDVPAGATSVQWSYAAKFGSNVLRVTRPGDDQPITAWLKDGATSELIPLQGVVVRSALASFIDYVALGFTHIVPKGLDHILFVLGLYLLSTKFRPLLWQVSAFTLAHSITLALGVYGIIKISPTIVEPLIAISIVYVAVENILTSKLSPWRPLVVFAFGLLHGLGFASVIQEIGLPRSEFVSGLVGFNVGVEAGQLAVIAIAWLMTGVWFAARPWYRSRIVVPASAVIALIGLYWSVERIFLV